VVSVSVITPTVARPSLRQTLESIVPQLGRGDEIIVISDGKSDIARDICAPYVQCVYLETEPSYVFGNKQRDYGIEKANGTHIAFCDDDDIFLPWALQSIRKAADSHPDAMFIFKVEPNGYKAVHHPHLWVERTIRKGNIMSCGVVVPNRPDLPKWQLSPDEYAADFYFAQQCAQHCEVIWRDEVIARTRP
jgi:glycosyltransferase involved in cell wall biosynthesis